MDPVESVPKSIVARQGGRLRLAIGALQGLALYGLYRAVDVQAWPATQSYLFAALFMVALFVPTLLLASVGHLDRRQMLKWLSVVAMVVVVWGLSDIWTGTGQPGWWFGYSQKNRAALPGGTMVFFAAVALYIAHSLVLSAAIDRRRIASYSTYFDVAWKLALQLKLAAIFVGVLWALLWMGAALFKLIKLEFLETLLGKPWFSIPVITFAFACAFHLTDVRDGIVRGIRSLLLVLLSWLAPIAALLVWGFLASLIGTGLEPLWATRYAAGLLIGTGAALVLLVNAAFQNGTIADEVPIVLRVGARACALALTPVIAIAAYALMLRVQQYGWTADRIIGAACIVVGTCYAGGYLYGALDRRRWLHAVRPTNIAAALLIVAVLFALFTPIADPARVSVADQVARLQSGRISAGKFDFEYLKFHGGRYGKEALERLKAEANGADADLMRERVDAALSKEYRWSPPPKADIDLAFADMRVWPKGASLPQGLGTKTWRNVDTELWKVPQCLRTNGLTCDAYLVDIDGDEQAEVVVTSETAPHNTAVFARNGGEWGVMGTIPAQLMACPGVREALQAGQFRLVPPQQRDIEVAGQRLRIQGEFFPSSNCQCQGVRRGCVGSTETLTPGAQKN